MSDQSISFNLLTTGKNINLKTQGIAKVIKLKWHLLQLIWNKPSVFSENEWNKIIKLIGINYAPDFVKYSLDDEKYIMTDVLENTNFVKSNCHKDEIITVLHSVVNNIIKASLLEVIKNEYY